MQLFRNYKIKILFWAGLMVLVSGCNVTEQIGERVAEEAADQLLGEGSVATSEAFTAAVATEAAALETAEAGGEAEGATADQVQSEPGSDESPVEETSMQNDANSGGDAGMGDDPLMVQPAVELPGLLTGIQNGGDLFDVYQIQAGANQIVRVIASSGAENGSDIFFDLGNDDGYDASTAVSPGGSAELVMGSSNQQIYTFEVTYNGNTDSAVYRFDVFLEEQNDAGTAGDAPDTVADAMLIEAGVPYGGASIGNETGANDFDCYRVNLPTAGGSVSVDLTVPADQPNEAYVRGELYDGAGELLTSNTAEFGSGILLAFGVESYEEASAGDYSFCLESYSFFAYGEYEFTVSLSEPSS